MWACSRTQQIITDIYTQTHPCSKVWHPHRFTHVLIRSPAFLSSQQRSPTVPSVSRFPSRVFVFQTKRLSCSSLDLSALPSLTETPSPPSLSVCQSVSQSIHKLLAPAKDAHSQNKKKRKTPGEEYPMKRSRFSAAEESGVWFLGLSV